MDEGKQPVPSWFWMATGLALLWEVLGCVMFLNQVTTDPATLPLDQRAMWQATPTWMLAAYAVAVTSGLAGTVLLLMRRMAAVPALLISLIAIIVQFSGLLIVPALRQRTPSDALLLPIVIAVIGYVIVMFARWTRTQGWLR